jgi:hypothetical protein
MDMIPVSSSAISAVGYDATTRRMKIKSIEGHTMTSAASQKAYLMAC